MGSRPYPTPTTYLPSFSNDNRVPNSLSSGRIPTGIPCIRNRHLRPAHSLLQRDRHRHLALERGIIRIKRDSLHDALEAASNSTNRVVKPILPFAGFANGGVIILRVKQRHLVPTANPQIEGMDLPGHLSRRLPRFERPGSVNAR